MEEIQAPKKERKFLKSVVNIAKVLANELVMGIARKFIGKAIDKVGNKRQGLVIASIILASTFAFAQYPATGNKQRLGYQTTGDGLVFRGRTNDTTALKPSTINNAYFILDTVNNVLFNYIKTKGGWVFNNTDTVINNITVDTTSLSNRINLKLNISDTASMLIPYFKDTDTTGLNLPSRFAAKLNISDTASMLTNYLRTATAASTYLPLTGGTLIGSLDINTNDGGNNFQDSTLKITYNQSSLGVNQNVTGIYSSVNTTGYTSTGILSEASTIYSTAIGVKGKATQSDINGPGVAYGIVGEIAASGSGSNGSTYAGYFNNTSTVGGNNYGLFVNTASGGDYGIYQTGNGINYLGSNTSIGGTLGVTGATTLSAPLTVNSSAVFNEGSTDSDFRVESDGNVNMVFVDASTDRVGIGTNAPDKTLHVNGEVKIATVTATPTSLLGKDGSNVVGELGLGTGMSVGSGILSVQAAGASATGLVTSFGSQTFGGNKTFNGNVNISTGTLDVGSTGTFGGRVKTNWLERNYAYSTSSSFTVSVNTTWQDINTNVLTTLTLPNPATYPGKELHLRQTGTGNLQSDSSNIIPFNTPPTGSTSTGILTASVYEAVTLVSDGTNWIIMQRSEN